MTVYVNKDTAREILLESWNKKNEINYSSEIDEKLRECLINDHKTYRYILFNGILAKCANPKVNPIALQAGASINGAYDARSLCHDVVVPFEKEFMENRLGGSNEPFLNKPARFKTLDKGNAVRAGKDQVNLEKLIELFNSLSFNSNPYNYLDHIIAIIKEKKINQIQFNSVDFNQIISSQYVINSIDKLLEKSFEGTSLVFSVLLILEINKISMNSDVKIASNPLNQSGSSSKEICDIDIIDAQNSYLFGIEVKDKNYFESDINHAVLKVKNSQASRMIFLCRSLDQYKGSQNLNDIIKSYEKNGFDLSIEEIKDFLKVTLLLKQNTKKSEIISMLNEHIKITNPPVNFVEYLREIIVS